MGKLKQIADKRSLSIGLFCELCGVGLIAANIPALAFLFLMVGGGLLMYAAPRA